MNKSKQYIRFFVIIAVCCGMVLLSACANTSKTPKSTVQSPADTTTTFILVRHAERANSNADSPLSPQGEKRARALADAIGHMGVTSIYCPNLKRNRDTILPLADLLDLELNLIPTWRMLNTRKLAKKFVEEALSQHAGGVVVWVGNKSPVGKWGGNLQEIYQKLGGTDTGPAHYDDLYIIKVSDNGPVKIKKTKYGPPA
jgi:hypothetical protein